MRRTVLVTGARGLCGREIARHFAAQGGWDVLRLDRKPDSGTDHIQFDLRNPIEAGADNFPLEIEGIIHAAAEVDQTTQSFEVIDANVRTSYNVARFAAAAGARWLINLSSSTVYGVPPRADEAEETVERPTTSYGLSKLLAEQAFRIIEPGVRVAHLRLGYVLGQGMSETSMVMRIARSLKNSEAVTLKNAATTTFQFLDTRDLARACELLAGSEGQGRYNLVSPDRVALDEVFDAIRACFPDSASRVEHVDDANSQFDTRYPSNRVAQLTPDLVFRSLSDSMVHALSRVSAD
jgi:nucleoside-diphosphate-sugar epimerase